MRRAGSRYGLPATNKSLKYAMEGFQDVDGCLGLIWLPNSTVALSMKKQARWQWIENREADPEWNFDSERVNWIEGYFTNFGFGFDNHQEDKEDKDDVVRIEYFGRYTHVPHATAVSTSGDRNITDKRHQAFLAARCCGCSMCSQSTRWKSLKKGKGRKNKITRRSLLEATVA